MVDKFEIKDKQFEEICKSLKEQFARKNRDYGNSFFEQKGSAFEVDNKLQKVDFYVQLKRKFSRLANFANAKLSGEEKKNLVMDETEEDTVRDIAVYCVMELIKNLEEKTNDSSKSSQENKKD